MQQVATRTPGQILGDRVVATMVEAGVTLAELLPKVTPAQALDRAPRPDHRDPIFAQVVDYLNAQFAQVEPLYQLEKAGQLKDGKTGGAQGREFIDGQLLRGGEMLGSLWLTAWRHATPDPFLQRQLLKRRPLTPKRE